MERSEKSIEELNRVLMGNAIHLGRESDPDKT